MTTRRKISTAPSGTVQVGLDGVTFPQAGTFIYSGTCSSNTEVQKPMESTILSKAYQIQEVLRECLRSSATIRGTVFGEGEATGDAMKALPSGDCLSSLLTKMLTDACKLRGELQSISNRIDDTMKKGVN